MKKFLVAGIAAIALSSAPALAADYPAKAGPAPAMWDWSGFYLGVEAGSLRTKNEVQFITGGAPFDIHQHDGIAGAIVGWQKQFGALVLGVEANLGFSFGNFGSTSCPAGPPCQSQAQMTRVSTGGGRLGWALQDLMPYISGGYAYGRFIERGVLPTGIIDQDTENTHGWYWGGGFDWRVAGNTILGVEYRHYGFSSKLFTPHTPAGVAVPGDNLNMKSTADTLMARLTWKFGGSFGDPWGKGPVVAKN